jgi:hypothetical protein
MPSTPRVEIPAAPSQNFCFIIKNNQLTDLMKKKIKETEEK